MFQHGSKVTLDHNGSYHKGFVHYSRENGFDFVVKCNLHSSKVSWSTPIHDFERNLIALFQKHMLHHGHTTFRSLLCSTTTNMAPSLNFTSAKKLLGPCQSSLIKALHPSNLDRDIWIKSYNEEKDNLSDIGVHELISKNQYLALRRSGKYQSQFPPCVFWW